MIDPASLSPSEAGPEWRRLRLAWREAIDLATGATRLIPSQAVHCPAPDGEPLGLGVVPWTSSGLAAHPDRDAALLHALLELG